MSPAPLDRCLNCQLRIEADAREDWNAASLGAWAAEHEHADDGPCFCDAGVTLADDPCLDCLPDGSLPCSEHSADSAPKGVR